MTPRALRLVLGMLPAACLAGLAAAQPRSPPARLVPVHLRCEYLNNPVGIDEPAPRLSWQFQSTGRGLRQTAYRILVASSDGNLRAGRGDFWDSGQVASSQSTHVVYQGRPLTTSQRCVWSVRVWSGDGAASNLSEPASWEMGLVGPGDWTADWIGLPSQSGPPPSLAGSRWIWTAGSAVAGAPRGSRCFRKQFDLEAAPARATLLVAVDDEATLFLNGREVGQARGWQSATALEVAEHLRAGSNALAVRATNQQGPAGLLVRMVIERGGGSSPQIVETDASWREQQAESPGWTSSNFDDRAWNRPAELGLMGIAPWNQVQAGPAAGGPSPYLRKSFRVQRTVRRARIYATALGVYRLMLNGQRVGRDILSPGWTDYRKRVQYQTYDVTEALDPGENVIGAVLGDGWYCGALGWALARNNFGPSPPRLRLQLEIEYDDGSRQQVASDASWAGATSPILESDIYAGETYDARLELPGWSSPGYDATRARRAGGAAAGSAPGPAEPTWKPVTIFADPHPALNAQMDPPIRLTEELGARKVTEPQPGSYVFDLGQNIVGVARLKVEGPAGTRVTMRFAEVLNPDGTVYRDNLRRARATDVYTLRGEGREVFEPHFTYHGFRYVEVTGYPGRPPSDAMVAVAFNSAMERTSRFSSSSELVNRLYQNIIWGQRGNMMSVPTDCPQRDERLGWMGDAEIFARTACFNMDMAAFLTKWMRDIVDAQSPEGFFSDVSPRVIDLADGAPAWADAGIVVPYTAWRCYGDTRIVERNFDAMARYVDLIHRANPDSLWLKRRNNDFGDWVAAGGPTNKDLIASAFFAYDARLMAEMAAAVGRSTDADRFQQLAEESRAAFNRRFLAADGKYAGDTQTAYAIALGMGLVPADRREQVVARYVESIRRAGDHLTTGFIGTAFLLPTLSDAGQDEIAFRLLTNRTYPSWGYTIEKGATTIWELWNSDTQGPGMNSRNHFAFGSVGEWIQRYLAGIEIGAPGYEQILIRPHPGSGLRYAETSYASLRGPIVSSWSTSAGTLTLTVTLPANTRATVELPIAGLKQARILEGERPVWQNGKYMPSADGITGGRLAGDRVALDVGSGSYVFKVGP